MSSAPDITTDQTVDRIESTTAVECAETGDLVTSPSIMFLDGPLNEIAECDEPSWFQRIFDIDDGEVGCEPAPAGGSSPFSLMFLGTEWDSAPNPGTSYTPENRLPLPSPQGRPPHHPRTYTLEKANELASALRALPAKDPAQRRLDKQAVIRHIAEEITALQQRGYTLEEIAQAITTEDVAVTTPTLKSYLQRIKKPSRGKGGRKPPRASALPLVLRRGGH